MPQSKGDREPTSRNPCLERGDFSNYTTRMIDNIATTITYRNHR